MLLSPILYVIAAIAGTFVTATLFHSATRRTVNPLIVIAGHGLNGVLLLFCLWQFFVCIEPGNYGALSTFGVALFAPIVFDFFSVAGLGMNKIFAAQSASVRVFGRAGVPAIGWMLTIALMEVGRYTFGISSSTGLIALVSVSALLALGGLVLLLLKVTPEEQGTTAFRLRAARRMLITRVNWLTTNNLLVYVGISIGLTGTIAKTLTGVLFGLNFFLSCLLISHGDTAALDPEQSDRKRSTQEEAVIAAENDTMQPSRSDRLDTIAANNGSDCTMTVSARRL